MKIFVNIIRVLVGLLFIISGLVKANDPIGLSYKMQEFFDLWGMSFLNTASLGLSVVVIALEIIAGAALLLGWKVKWNSWLLLILVVFFTLLTGYAFFSGKVRNCGCFGDCIPLTSGGSFLKDLVLLVAILIIFFNKKYIKPVFPKAVALFLLLCVTVFSFGLQWYTLHYLPLVDCLPFKKGGVLPQLMTIPNNAIPDSTAITFVYKKNGKEIEFQADQFPADFNEDTYEFVRRYDKVLRKGWNNKPAITGFILKGPSGGDSTHEILSKNEVLLLFIEDATVPVKPWQQSFENIYRKAVQQGIPVYAITATGNAVRKSFSSTGFSDMTVLEADRTMIRTAARVRPELYLLRNTAIAGKWGYKNFSKAGRELFPEQEKKKVTEPPFGPPAQASGDTIII
jgi:uncharacterized membrane protein YphA (DoxX/SURF4 family)